MLYFNKKEGLDFSCINIIDFFMIGLAIVKRKNLDKNYFVDWIQNNTNNA